MTASQLDQCEMAWLLLRAVSAPRDVCQRLKQIADQGLAWLFTPYLETLGECDPKMALRIADVLLTLGGQPEIANAFRIRMAILLGELTDAQVGIGHAASLWPDAGWLQTMRAWHADALTKQK